MSILVFLEISEQSRESVISYDENTNSSTFVPVGIRPKFMQMKKQIPREIGETSKIQPKALNKLSKIKITPASSNKPTCPDDEDINRNSKVLHLHDFDSKCSSKSKTSSHLLKLAISQSPSQMYANIGDSFSSLDPCEFQKSSLKARVSLKPLQFSDLRIKSKTDTTPTSSLNGQSRINMPLRLNMSTLKITITSEMAKISESVNIFDFDFNESIRKSNLEISKADVIAGNLSIS